MLRQVTLWKANHKHSIRTSACRIDPCRQGLTPSIDTFNTSTATELSFILTLLSPTFNPLVSFIPETDTISLQQDSHGVLGSRSSPDLSWCLNSPVGADRCLTLALLSLHGRTFRPCPTRLQLPISFRRIPTRSAICYGDLPWP